MSNLPSASSAAITRAIAWCLAWGSELTPKVPLTTLNGWRANFSQDQMPNDSAWTEVIAQLDKLTELTHKDISDISALETALADAPNLKDIPIGLIYGGVTKVKSYVFESADLQEIRGASALLDRINLVDLPALFHAEASYYDADSAAEEGREDPYELCKSAPEYCKHVRTETFESTENTNAEASPTLEDALIPELMVYSTGGNILALCPSAFVSQLCNAIEKRYTTETLTANSCAVGDSFRAAELYFGLLQEPISETPWVREIKNTYKDNAAIRAYFGLTDKASAKTITPQEIEKAFGQRKNFGELVGKLTSQFNQRRSGINNSSSKDFRPSRRYPPMFETHPYLMRDDSDIRSAVRKIDELPDAPLLSEPTARKRRVGQLTKRYEMSENWFRKNKFKAHWTPEPTEDSERGAVFQSWVEKLEVFLKKKNRTNDYDPEGRLFSKNGNFRAECRHTREARSLTEIGDASDGYVAYIYADGNSMGRYIREQIKTPTQYQQFSRDIFAATEQSVYCAIADHIQPHYYQPDAKSSRQPKEKKKDPVWIHPFEIVTIGGDDVLLIVPANKAMPVAEAIGQHFERILLEKGERYADTPLSAEQKQSIHRYRPADASALRCRLSTSSGVLITAVSTPIYYALNLVTQLQKSAKKYLKSLTKAGYRGGTVDFLVLKAVTMITSDIAAFRKAGLTLAPANRNHILKLQAAPYTLHELGGLIKTVEAIKASNFPKSQLYQIRSLLERGKRTAILNYRYFRARLNQKEDRELLESTFENAWCAAKTNGGNLAPWLPPKQQDAESRNDKTVYETIWRELVELEPFIEKPKLDEDSSPTPVTTIHPTQEAS